MKIFCRFLLLFLTACSSNDLPKVESFRGNAMTIDYQVLIGSPLSTSQKKEVQQIIAESFKEIDDIYNKWNPNSELSLINRHRGGSPIPLSKKLEKLLLLTDQVVRLTEGRFDPTIESVQKIWKKHLDIGTTPSNDEIEKARAFTGWNKLYLSNGMITKAADEVTLDLGGIAKGYGVDLIVENLNDSGFKDVFVEWGGEIRSSGKHPEGRPWRIFISRLDNEDPKLAIAHLDLQDQAIATSGDYLQFWTIVKDGKATTFFHIIDPDTLEPLQVQAHSIASTSVVAPQCALADGLATAAMLFSTAAEAKAWSESLKQKYPHLSFWIVTREISPPIAF